MIRELTIGRPERRNALDIATIARLRRELDEAAADEAVRAIVIVGDDRAFSAGADLKELATLDEAGLQRSYLTGVALMDELEQHPCLVVAAIEGYCLGGGVELALACDLRVAGDGATFGMPEVSIGMLPTWGAHYRLPRIVGLGRAKELVLTGRRFAATDALAYGLLAEVVPAGTAPARACELAAAATESSRRFTMGQAKALLETGFTVDHATARRLDALAERALMHETRED